MKDSAEFERDWKASHRSVFEVALFLRRRGLNLRIPVPILRKSEAERWNCVDDGDIECIQIIQVKWRDLDFTSAADYPHKTIFLDEVYKVDPKLPRLLAYAIVNKSHTSVALIRATTKKHWTIVDVDDENQGRICQTYVCPKEFATFASLIEGA